MITVCYLRSSSTSRRWVKRYISVFHSAMRNHDKFDPLTDHFSALAFVQANLTYVLLFLFQIIRDAVAAIFFGLPLSGTDSCHGGEVRLFNLSIVHSGHRSAS